MIRQVIRMFAPSTRGRFLFLKCSPNRWKQPITHVVRVRRVARQLRAQKSVLDGRTTEDYQRERNRGRKSPPGPESDCAAEECSDRTGIAWMPDVAIGSGRNQMMSAFSLDPDDRREEAIDGHGPRRQSPPQRQQQQTSDLHAQGDS